MSLHRPPLAAPSDDLLAELAGIVGASNALRDPDTQAPYLTEWRDLYVGRTPVVLRPGSTDEVAAILARCHAARVGVVTQGGNTGLVGGQIPSEAGTEIVISLTRLDRLRDLDPEGSTMTVEAGMTLARAQAAAAAADRLFPLSMASESAATIGGNIATNAGGVAVLAYGTPRQLVLGLEVVLADGRVWDGLRALRKDNTGYDMRALFIGSEGTLGVITAATLKIFPRPAGLATAFIGLPDIEAVAALFRLAARRAGPALTAFEFMSGRALGFATQHAAGVRLPISAPPPWAVLIEVSTGAEDAADDLLAAIVTEATDAGVSAESAVAASETHRAAFWRLRESLSEAQKPEGGSIKHDISLPVAAIPDFLRRAEKVVEGVCPGARPVPFGHFGDGNIHYNVSQPIGMDRASYLALWQPMSERVHDLVLSLGGSISAEHGIGRLKRDELLRARSDVEVDLMRRMKAALDPRGILNPGKVL